VDGVDVLTRGEVLESALQAREYLVTCGVPAALVARDPRLWGRREVTPGHLGWLDLPVASAKLLPQLDGLVSELRSAGLDHVALIGVGPESLASQALAGHASHAMTVLDGSDPAAVDVVLSKLGRTVVVIVSKRGVSLEGDAYRRIMEQAFRDHGLTEAEIASRFVVITDHGSPLDSFARQCGYRVGLTDPGLPGHFGALSAYGVVPAHLAGADVSTALEEAADVVPALSTSEDNPGLLLGAILGGCANHARNGVVKDKFVLRDPYGTSPQTAWITQLVATATARHGRGILPIDPAGRVASPDLHGITLNPAGGSMGDGDTSLWAPKGAQFLVWEYAAAVAGWLMGVNPFETRAQATWEGEDDAAALLRTAGDGPLPAGLPTFVDDDVEVRTDAPVRDLNGLIEMLTLGLPTTGYLCVVGYLAGALPCDQLAAALTRRSGRPVICGSGPGYLQGTGAYHKEGPPGGTFVIVTGEPPTDHRVPGRPYSIGMLRQARALADVQSLRRRGLPIAWLHLRDTERGVERLLRAAYGQA
jgi:glucose-6-phosphate isomerase